MLGVIHIFGREIANVRSAPYKFEYTYTYVEYDESVFSVYIITNYERVNVESRGRKCALAATP